LDAQQENSTLYTRTTDGTFIPVSSPSTGPNPPSAPPPPSLPAPGTVSPPSVPPPVIWDPWPDGFIERDFTHEEFKATNNFCSHWCWKYNGGYTGQINAEQWQDGLTRTRRCRGVILCRNEDCEIVVRRPTTDEGSHNKLQIPCKCGAELYEEECGIVLTTWEWKGGIHFVHPGYHPHLRPPPIHLLQHERAQFNNIVKHHPQTGPLGLLVGPPELGGPGKSVADISPALSNPDRISYEQTKLKKTINGTGTAETFIQAFEDFDTEHPGFLIHSSLGKITVFCFQSPLMRQQLFKENLLEGPINGMVNDGAHGWWRDCGAILMVTSSYCPLLNCWIPGVFSYTNGASAEHFKHHFRAVFQSIAEEAKARSIEVVDRFFAGVMDFSEAERLGFIDAFTKFWQLQPGNSRSIDELKAAGQALLKGCREHFRAGVTRVSCISAAVDPFMADYFVSRALALLDAPNSQEFIARAELVISEYPKLTAWMKWWTRPAHTAMLCDSECKMDIELWESLPDTNNAEEAMHWKLYSACGRDHDVFGGLKGLYAVAKYYERMYNSVLSACFSGIRTHYGEKEPWKVLADNIGRTKNSRAPDPSAKKRKHNDGRAPDTSKEILKKPTKHKKVNNDGRPPDTVKALKLTKSSKKDAHPQKRQTRIQSRKPKQPSPSSSDSGTSFNAQTLSSQRDKFRRELRQRRLIAPIGNFDSLWVYVGGLVRMDYDKAGCQRVVNYFQTLLLDICECSGGSDTGGLHVEILQTPRRQPFLHLGNNVRRLYSGNVAAYLDEYFSINKSPVDRPGCWRVKDSICLCPGDRQDITDLVVSIPVLFPIELEKNLDKKDDEKTDSWDLPSTIVPLSEEAAQHHNIVYDLVRYAMATSTSNNSHFTAKYISGSPGAQKVYAYNDMANQGRPIRQDVEGLNSDVNPGELIHYAFYYLRGGVEAQNMFIKLLS
ncbi:hypothetical protein BJ912DRAFT_852761, partial [Pholiota molesta]